MPQLTDEHINYIIKDLSYKGLVDERASQEILDHLCCLIENEMASGKRFIDAYREALKSFGHTRGIRQLQHQIVYTKPKSTSMLKNYLLIAWRNHMKNKFYTLINVSGLALGIAACLTIMLFVLHEVSYDRYNEKADRIFRVNTEIKVGAVHHELALGAASLPEYWSTYPEIESITRIYDRGWFAVKRENTAQPNREKLVWADSTFFNTFTLPLLSGDAASALTRPNAIAISRKLADKYFPDGDAHNKTLLIGNENYNGFDPCVVTAVFEDIPVASHFHFDVIRSMVSTPFAKNASLVGGGELHVYLLLREGSDATQLEAKFTDFVETHVAPQLAAALQNDFSMEKFKAEGNRWHYSLTPLTDIHLHSDRTAEFEANSDISYVYLFSAIALFILVIACINFMNLSTARSADRAREVGIRKVMGSMRSLLVRQFLTESFLLTAAAFVLGLGIAYLFLPMFNQLALKNLSLPFDEYSFYLILLGAVVLVGIMAGLYPSFFLSAFKPVSVLKGKVTGGSSTMLRGGLVVFQFVISIFLIIGTIAIERQLNYIQNKKIGFNKEQVLVVHGAGNLGKQTEAFRNEVLRNKAVTDGTISGFLPVSGTWRNHNTWWPEGKAPTGADVNSMVGMQVWEVDHHYLPTLGMSLKKGRNFSLQFPADSIDAVIINEAALAAFEFGDDPIGKKISCFSGTKPDGTPDFEAIRSWTVVGVVENFHFESMRNNIEPVGLFLGRSSGFVSFRVNAGSTPEVVQAVEQVWNKMAPEYTFKYSFLDEDFGKMYDSEARLGIIFAIFAGLAIIIACLGLFALTSFAARQRTKEIGIRKTLGASVESIVLLLSKSYGKLVIIAFVVSAPLAWASVNWWLQGYSYKAQIGVTVYILAGIVTFAIAMITIGYQSVRVARSNPASSLRSE